MLRRHLADPANKRPANQEKLGLGGSGNVFGDGFHGEKIGPGGVAVEILEVSEEQISR